MQNKAHREQSEDCKFGSAALLHKQQTSVKYTYRMILINLMTAPRTRIVKQAIKFDCIIDLQYIVRSGMCKEKRVCNDVQRKRKSIPVHLREPSTSFKQHSAS